ncbi:MAG: thiopurine S-methyltransferase [Burkholderiales bacterium]|nr:thiopurine S-methyltransferase [Burkholderiales bacterium]MDR4515967.1 thiopurine S-methyltransferase [Nitrosomonas sp.]
MNKDYWLKRWEHNEIGFHQDSVNPYLLEYWKTLQLAAGSRVFVPLCGKTRDMLWLRAQGHSVLGVELSARAVQAFFRENQLIPNHDGTSDKRFDHYAASDIHILLGDFFDLNKQDLGNICAIYDRASLVALPSETRCRYANKLCSIVPPGSKVLLVGLDYPQSEMQGPPYAVPPKEVAALYQPSAEVRLLTQIDVLADNPRFQQRGLTRLVESVYLLTLHHAEKS